MAPFLLFLILLSPLSWGADSKYSISDLEVLTQEGGYEEFFKHALDIRPSERQEKWKGMVSRMGDAYTKSLLARSEINSSDFKKVQELWQWLPLKSDDVFKARKQEISLRYLTGCLKKSPPCWDEVKKFWEHDTHDAETAFKIAEIISQHKDSPLLLWPFLDVALKSPLSEFYCQKDFALKALWGKLEVDYIRLGVQGDLMKKIDETVHPDCLGSLIKEARSKLVTPEKNGDRELAHQILLSQLKADQKTSDFFHTTYLLENPSKGELFNYSWNRLKELGNSFSRREAVMNMIRNLDPLPDDILSSFDLTKKRVILSHFKRHFPEYIDHYTDQCLLFYGGKSSFPRGNPTMNCQELMNSELGPQLIDPSKLKQYQDIRKI